MDFVSQLDRVVGLVMHIRTESSFDSQWRWFLRLLTETQLIDGLHAERIRFTCFKTVNDKPETQAALLSFKSKMVRITDFEYHLKLKHFSTCTCYISKHITTFLCYHICKAIRWLCFLHQTAKLIEIPNRDNSKNETWYQSL